MKLAANLFYLMLSASLIGMQIPVSGAPAPDREQRIIDAAKAEPSPHINGPSVIGIRPGTPLIDSLAVTGDRPMTFSARHLPSGLTLDSKTGILTGKIKRAEEYTVTFRAKNAAGEAEKQVKIVCGDTLALTPPMGWNSYDAFGDAVTEAETLTNAQWLKDHLQPLGWNTVVVDFRWYDSKADGLRVQDPEGVMIDEFGRCIPAPNRFPSATNGAGFKPLADKIHAMGLKFGIHIMRGIPRKAVEANLPIAGSSYTAAQAPLPESNTNRTCVWNRDMYGVNDSAEGVAWYCSIAKQYADWGVDYIKCDDIANLQRGIYYDASEIWKLSMALKKSDRSIILSLSPGATPVTAGLHVKQFANLWRISGDFWDNWKALNHNFDLFAAWQGDTGPGHWPDGDMIPFGHICVRNCDVRPDRWTRFTRDEQLTLMSLWALNSSPLMLGMNLPDNDAWTTAILSNPEVLAINQDPLGRAAVRRTGPPHAAEIWTKELADGSVAVGFFNRTDKPAKVDFPWNNLSEFSFYLVRDVWTRSNIGEVSTILNNHLITELPPHGCVLLKLQKVTPTVPELTTR